MEFNSKIRTQALKSYFHPNYKCKLDRYSSDLSLIFAIMTICMKAETFIIPMQNEKATLYISVSMKQAQNGKGPKTDLDIPPRPRDRTRS